MILILKKNYYNSEYLSEYGFYVPSGLETSFKDIDYVCRSIIKIKNKFKFQKNTEHNNESNLFA